MTAAKITKQAPPVSRKEIEQFEQRNGISLPDSYKAFLLKTNGGEPTPDRLFIPGWSGQSTCVNHFLGIGQGGYYDLEASFQNAEDYIPDRFIPIAIDTGGNMLCTCTSGDSAGKIFFWDHEHPQGDAPSSLYEVASSVDELLEKLV